MTIFVTGGTGFIGRYFLAEITRKGLSALVLMRDIARLDHLRTSIAALGGVATRVDAVQGDLSERALGLQSPLPELMTVVHLGAAFAWGLGKAEARATNVNGALEVAGLAARHNARLVMVTGFMMENREHLNYLGVAGKSVEHCDWEEVYRKAGNYEASKLEGALRVRQEAQQLGLDMIEVQPATVSGDSQTGDLPSSQPLYQMLENLRTGRLSMVPGKSSCWLPLVSVDTLARIIAAACIQKQVPLRLLALDTTTPNLKEMLQDFADTLGVRAPKRHLSIGLLRTLLAIPGMERWMNTSRETLHFLQSTRFDTGVTVSFCQSAAVEWPPIGQSMAATGKFIQRNAGAD